MRWISSSGRWSCGRQTRIVCGWRGFALCMGGIPKRRKDISCGPAPRERRRRNRGTCWPWPGNGPASRSWRWPVTCAAWSWIEGFAQARLRAGRLLLGLGRPGEARELLQEHARRRPGAEGWAALGDCLYALGQSQPAEELWRRALRELSPEVPRERRAAAELYLRLSRAAWQRRAGEQSLALAEQGLRCEPLPLLRAYQGLGCLASGAAGSGPGPAAGIGGGAPGKRGRCFGGGGSGGRARGGVASMRVFSARLAPFLLLALLPFSLGALEVRVASLAMLDETGAGEAPAGRPEADLLRELRRERTADCLSFLGSEEAASPGQPSGGGDALRAAGLFLPAVRLREAQPGLAFGGAQAAGPRRRAAGRGLFRRRRSGPLRPAHAGHGRQGAGVLLLRAGAAFSRAGCRRGETGWSWPVGWAIGPRWAESGAGWSPGSRRWAWARASSPPIPVGCPSCWRRSTGWG